MAKGKDDKIVLEIIKRYGPTLDLKESPYLIVEIIRQFGSKLGGLAETCQPPGGTPPPRPKTPEEIMLEIKARLAEIETLSVSLQNVAISKPAAKQKALSSKAAGKKPAGKAKKPA